MKRRTFAISISIASLLFIALSLAAVPLAVGSSPRQEDATAQQQTVEALVAGRFTQTAAAQQMVDATATADAALHIGPTLTAQFEATVDAAFDQALTATALSELDPALLAAEVSDNLAKIRTLDLAVTTSGLVLDETFTLTQLAGQLELPDRLYAELTLESGVSTGSMELTVVENEQYVRSATLTDGQWQVFFLLPGLDVASLWTGLDAALHGTLQVGTVNERGWFSLVGALSAEQVSALTMGLLPDSTASAQFFINPQTMRVKRIVLELPQSEADPLTWEMTLTNFNGEQQVLSPFEPTATPQGFEPTPTPRPEIFPTNTVAQVQAAEQVFENGRMFWIRHTLQVWVMIASPDSSKNGDWHCYNDIFVEGEQETDPDLQAPEGLIQPKRGFGKLWRTVTGLRDALGWAVTPEFELTSTYTYVAGGYVENEAYVAGPGEHRLTTLDGKTISFFEEDIRGDCVGGTWRLSD